MSWSWHFNHDNVIVNHTCNGPGKKAKNSKNRVIIFFRCISSSRERDREQSGMKVAKSDMQKWT